MTPEMMNILKRAARAGKTGTSRYDDDSYWDYLSLECKGLICENGWASWKITEAGIEYLSVHK